MKLIHKVKVRYKQVDKDQKKKFLNIWKIRVKHQKKFFRNLIKVKHQTTIKKEMLGEKDKDQWNQSKKVIMMKSKNNFLHKGNTKMQLLIKRDQLKSMKAQMRIYRKGKEERLLKNLIMRTRYINKKLRLWKQEVVDYQDLQNHCKQSIIPRESLDQKTIKNTSMSHLKNKILKIHMRMMLNSSQDHLMIKNYKNR